MKKTAFNAGWTCNGLPVTLPHDATLHAGRGADAPSGSAGAFFLGSEYVYEKRFPRPQGEHVILQFEGVYKDAKVTLNGKEIGGCAYGYLPFFTVLDDALTEGENTLQVACSNAGQPDSRWYAGAGIYRPVWLWEGPKGSLEPESVRITTLGIDPPAVRVDCPVEASVEILDGEKVIAAKRGKSVEVELPGARLWSEEDPALYTCRVTENGDELTQRFGIRTVEWSPKGLFVNGKETLLRGGCLHQDSGVLGAAAYDEAEYRRVKLLKEAGFNAIRSAHNPANRALLDACDELGLYVMDESWDMWFFHKTPHDYAAQWREHYKDDLAAMVARDYNHPCVLMYSIGNEVSEPCREEGVEAAREMAALLHQLDGTRAVTAGINLMILAQSAKGKFTFDPEKGRDTDSGQQGGGMNSTMFNLMASFVGTGMNKAANGKKADAVSSPVLDALDIAGYNYASGRYPLEGKAHPERVVVGSETFPQDIAKNWAMVEKYPYLIGDFMWTAWDYLGETGIGAWAYTDDARGFAKPYPWLLADAGAFDLLGNPGGEVFQAAAVWGKLPQPAICVRPINHDRKVTKAVWRGTNSLPSWSWQGCEGRQAAVEVYANPGAATAELSLSGRPVGKARFKDGKAQLKVKYFPGTLTAVVKDAAGKELGRAELKSALGVRGVTAAPEKPTVKPGEVFFVPVLITGENGSVECNADRKLTVSVTGGELLGFGSANPRTEESYVNGQFTTYYGRALAVIRAGESGTVTVTVTGEGEAAAEVAIR